MPRAKKRPEEVRELGKRIRVQARKGGYPALGELAEIACAEWGGAHQIIAAIKADIDDSPAGSPARQRAFASLVELLKSAAKQQEDRRVDDEMLTDEDLRAEFYELMGTSADGIKTTETDAAQGSTVAAAPGSEGDPSQAEQGACAVAG